MSVNALTASGPSSRIAVTGGGAVAALLRAADRVRRRAVRVLEPHGVTLQQYHVLCILDSAREDGVPTLEVAARMIEETPGVTRLLDRLEAKAYIRRQRCPRDRRQHLCWLSGEGARLVEKLRRVIESEHERVLQPLAPRDRQRLVAFLDAIGSHE
jgi:DNA-binding MarR family transcriptional regulator